MPVSKKPRSKAVLRTSTKTGAAAAVPDRRAMESFLAALSGHRGDDATAKAQDVMYDAWERTTSRSRIALAHKALGISPLCADAYVLLGEEARSIKEARDYYAKGVEAGELALGPEGFKQYAGHFWGFLETRPYMRARAGLAGTLLKLGDVDGAIAHYRDMLKLNPNDNQGIRYVLAGCLLRQDNDSALKELLTAYEDGNASWLYPGARGLSRERGQRRAGRGAGQGCLVRQRARSRHTGRHEASSDIGRWLRHHGRPGRGDLLRHRMRPGVGPHARGDRMADKACRHFGAETSAPCDDALILLSVQF